MSHDDNTVLLASDTEAGREHQLEVEQKTSCRRISLALLVVGGVASTAAWKWSAAPPTKFAVDGVMSAANWYPWRENPLLGVEGDQGFCTRLWRGTPWPHLHDDVNWQGECSEHDHFRCQDTLVNKFSGDYFDAVVSYLASEASWNFLVPGEAEQARWKNRVQKRMRELAKGMFPLIGTPAAAHKPSEWAPGAKFGELGALCDVIFKLRPVVTTNMAAPVCRSNEWNHRTWESFERAVGTKLPSDWDNLCQTQPCLSDFTQADAHYPSMLTYQNNPKLEKCRHLLRRRQDGAEGNDFIEAPLTALETRMCIAGRDVPETPLSRNWVRACIPSDPEDSPRREGWPGWVFGFIREYGIVETSCVADYDVPLRHLSCPAVCDDGESLNGYLRRFGVDTEWKYTVIYNKLHEFTRPGFTNSMYQDLTHTQHEQAKTHIFNDGPVVGLILKSFELAACANDESILYSWSGRDEKFWGDQVGKCDDLWDNTGESFHSVVVFGWGQTDREGRWYSILSHALMREEGEETRIAECGVKMFVIPPPLPVSSFEGSFWMPAFQAYRAEASCQRPADFCDSASGYTATEDCDGDGVLDHWCYRASAGDPYEAFVSSRYNCEIREEGCRRSVLPGSKFACQRPNGWCMNGERYRRNVDCDGDGHFDHVCTSDALGHEGYISSANDCIDTWEEGSTGRKCEVTSVSREGDILPYKFVHESGDCREHVVDQCFVSHRDWPNNKYSPNAGCQLKVQWSGAPSEQAAPGCTTQQPQTQALYAEVIQRDTERPVFLSTGALTYGDLLRVAGKNLDRQRIEVRDGDLLEWHSDRDIEGQGWQVCLRLRQKVPSTPYAVKCQELGDDLWVGLDVYDKDSVRVDCADPDCSPGTVTPFGGYLDTFVLTTNLCDAGWHVTRSKRFTVTFFDATPNEEGRFRVEP